MKKLIALALSTLLGLLTVASCSTISKPFVEKAEVDQKFMDESVHVKLESCLNDHCKAGVAKIRSGNYEGAKSELLAAIADNEKDDTAHFALGVVYQETGDMASAHRHYQRAVELSNKDSYVAALRRSEILLKN